MKKFIFLFLMLLSTNLFACHKKDCEKIYYYIQNQYENYQKILEDPPIDDLSYIEGKRDAYREMQHFMESYVY